MISKYLKKLARKYPSLARTINLWILWWFVFIVTQLQDYTLTWNSIQWDMLIPSIVIPILWWLEKRFRDLQEEIENDLHSNIA